MEKTAEDELYSGGFFGARLNSGTLPDTAMIVRPQTAEHIAREERLRSAGGDEEAVVRG